MTPLLKTTAERVWSGETRYSSPVGADELAWAFYLGSGYGIWDPRDYSNDNGRGFAVRSRR